MLGESCIIIKSDGLAQRGGDAVEDGQHDRNGFSGSLSNEPRRKIALPMADLGSGVDSLRPFMDGGPILDRIS